MTDQTGEGNVILYPGNEWVPPTSNLNYVPGKVRANNALVSLAPAVIGEGSGPKGFSAYVDQLVGSANVIVDVNGYFE